MNTMSPSTEAELLAQLREQLDPEKIPRHVAIIMDGNGRWAKQQRKSRIEGHKAGAQSVRSVVEAAAELGISALTLYAFSTENWRRPAMEIKALMSLLIQYLKEELKELQQHDIRLKAIGRLHALPKDVQKPLTAAMESTKDNRGMTLCIALNYGGQHEILDAVKNVLYLMQEQKISVDELTPEVFSRYLSTAELPELDLMIRTSGEMRVSNFLLWQLAYAELYVTPVLWPDFRKPHFYEAILNFQQRHRRFGNITE
ncbi:undecaprenyl diphosphate synthase [Candidatus Vecturithrix granuli]|uniref:Isoprenyl transferase n=1 Tax=Vecturithrix granuli TaxID=1499967 RepID=A0A081BVH8_VECG1|nr:undecaprenyl diphosphate synthase [Candidatus Vecturithrix granuli]